MTIDEKFDIILNKINLLDNKINSLDDELNALREEVKHNTIVTEELVNKCVQVIGESISMNAERFDRVDVDSIKRNYEVAVLYAKTVKEQVDSLAKKISA